MNVNAADAEWSELTSVLSPKYVYSGTGQWAVNAAELVARKQTKFA